MPESDEVETKYCRDCGEEINAKAEICPECGVRQEPPEQSSTDPQKSPGLAAVLSFLFVGLGQIYNGQIGKGLLLMVVVPILTIAVIVNVSVVGGALFGFLLWVLNITDAYSQAGKINAGEDPDF